MNLFKHVANRLLINTNLVIEFRS